ncbi:pseudouridine synthase [Ornithinibacillus bavariensis]|uniref:Pseudouridine synthase n=1 Tax=Ornithinibacillus bavariensis TaxID=545502 RepID=A0A920C8K5_9BACI|nr:pseudouridine synthase [Ornithinibacillus bavariensis]GIO28813.1 pseudouridine synthase [Ornithinibacillus bavariensis]
MRLDKLLANMGFGSRKDVKQLIKSKRVLVNDQVVKDSGLNINPIHDTVLLDGEKVEYKPYIYLMMNKPPGVISATEDKFDQTVIDLLPSKYKHYNPFPVGRLDKDTEGLLLLTNDGQLAHQLLSPKKEVIKTYYAKILGRVTKEDVAKFSKGVQLEDGYQTKPAVLNVLSGGDISEIEVSITEGKFHQVKRMFEAIDKKVMYLKRLSMGDLVLDKTLALGEYRELNAEELSYCQSIK